MRHITRKKTLLATLTLLSALVGVSGSSLAGLQTDEDVSIFPCGSGTCAVGALGTVRTDSSPVAYIRCTVQGFLNSNAVFCEALDLRENHFFCMTSNSTTLATAVSALDSGSRLYIYQVNGVCMQIDVTNSSEHRTKGP